jgi:hypothetical protein
VNVDLRRGTLRPAWLAFAVGLVPILAVHAAYVVAAIEQRVEWCIPYLEGCTSISKAARFGLANHLFKALMLPTAAALILFWLCAHAWMATQNAGAVRRRYAMTSLGVIGAVFLILYASFLGVEGEAYQWMRRYGVTVYFSFTVLAHMFLASMLPSDGVPSRLRRQLTALCATMLLLGVASLPLQHLVENRKAAVNAIEWLYALLMTIAFILVGLAWRRSGFRLRVDGFPLARE